MMVENMTQKELRRLLFKLEENEVKSIVEYGADLEEIDTWTIDVHEVDNNEYHSISWYEIDELAKYKRHVNRIKRNLKDWGFNPPVQINK